MYGWQRSFLQRERAVVAVLRVFPLVKHGLQVCLEHDGHEVAAAAADVDGEVPDAQLPVQHDPLLRGAQPVRHLTFSVPSIRFESLLHQNY